MDRDAPGNDLRVVVAEDFGNDAIAELRRHAPRTEAAAAHDMLDPVGETDLVVSADRVVRAQAVARGSSAAAHPALAQALVRGESLVFARIAGRLDAIAELPGLVAYWAEHRAHGSPWVLAALPRAGVARAIDARLELQCLALDVALEDPLFVQLDEGADMGEALSGYRVLWTDASRVLLALDAATSNDAIPAHGAHGHFRFLTPSPELLRPARVVAIAAATTSIAMQSAAQPPVVTPESYLADIARYAGLAPLDADGALRSRHSSHRDNARAVAALVAELTALGYAPQTPSFAFGGRVLRNVVADLPGTGELGVDAGLIVVGCHLDSTAARDPGYVPADSRPRSCTRGRARPAAATRRASTAQSTAPTMRPSTSRAIPRCSSARTSSPIAPRTRPQTRTRTTTPTPTSRSTASTPRRSPVRSPSRSPSSRRGRARSRPDNDRRATYTGSTSGNDVAAAPPRRP